MTYHLGIDLGTTYTAAAVWRDGAATIVNLGNRAPVVPSVVLLRDDEAVLTGEAAARRAMTEPQRVAREFKRRMGDPTPIIVGGSPYSADALTAKLLRWVVDKVAETEGGPPATIAISHPANWGEYKQDLLRQAVARADLDDVVIITEPEAAAIHYASQERIDVGSVITVYDLGGGTFDVALLRKSEHGWEVLGEPQGIERLGGVDFDEAVFQHVVTATDGVVTELDPDDPAALAAVARLRQECVDAKEALSSDTDVSIPVLLPNLQTEVRLTRSEFEQMVRPSLADTITTMSRALRSAGVEPDDVHAVLLVGGSSRIPLVAQMVGAELGRPVAVDAHPKHGIALGAAIVAAGAGETDGDTLVIATSDETPGSPLAAGLAAGATAGAVAGDTSTAATPVTDSPTAVMPASPPSGPPDEPPAERRRPVVPLAIGGFVVIVLLVVAAVVVLGGGDDPADTDAAPPAAPNGDGATDDDAAGNGSPTPVTEPVDEPDPPPATEAPAATEPPEPTVPPTTDAAPTTIATTTTTTTTTPIPDGPFVLLDEVTLENGFYRVAYTLFEFEPQIDGGDGSLHLHLFLDTTEPANAGVDGTPPGEWYITDEPDTDLTPFGPETRGAAQQMCAVVANVDHTVFDPESGTCLDLP